MDLRCERCKTLYELDDARVSEAGTTVRCTTCGHVFRVRKKVLLMTEAVSPGGEATAVPPPVTEKPPWRVRSPSGRVIAFRELTSMQKWIVERKFGQDDEISLHGDSWKRLGDIAELQPFFLLLEELDRLHALEERQGRAEPSDEAPTPPTPIRLEVAIESPSGPDATTGPGMAATAEWNAPGGDDTAPGRQDPAEPPRLGTPSAYALHDIEPPAPVEEPDFPQPGAQADLGVDPGVVGNDGGIGSPESEGRGKVPWALVLVVLAAVGVAAAAALVWVPAQEEKFRREAARARAAQEQMSRAAQEAETREREAQAKEELLAGLARRADAATAVPATGSGGNASSGLPRGPVEPERPASTAQASVTTAVPPSTSGGAAGPRAVQSPEPRGRTFDDWMAQGDRERDHARARAALDAYDRAIALAPARPEAHLGQGRALLDVGDARSAVAAFRRALELNPRYSVAEFWLGEAYRRAGQTAEAVGAYGRYLEAAPEGSEAGRAREALNNLQ